MIKKNYNLFQCPNDFSGLELGNNFLECKKCKNKFEFFDNDSIEIFPKNFPKWNLGGGKHQKVENAYRVICNEKSNQSTKIQGWGSFEPNAAGMEGYRAFVKKERELIKNLIFDKLRGGLMIDVSAGCGNYSIYLSSVAELMVHCEAENRSLREAKRLAEKANIKNIMFVRSNYLNLPYKDNAFDVVVCTDTLIRGKEHEEQLLKEMCRVLKKGGQMIMDFHGKKPLAKKRNPDVDSYSKNEISDLLRSLHMDDFKIYPFGYFPVSLVPRENLYELLDKTFKFFLPPIRYVVVAVK